LKNGSQQISTSHQPQPNEQNVGDFPISMWRNSFCRDVTGSKYENAELGSNAKTSLYREKQGAHEG